MLRSILIGCTVLSMATPLLADTVPLRVMSFNIRYATAPDGDNHWEKRKEFLVETIRSFDPDFLGTQETLAVQRDYLARQLSAYTVHAAGRDDGRDGGEMAAIYYRTQRFEKLDGGHFWLSPTPDQPGSKGWDAALPRIASWLKLRDRTAPNTQPILLLNTHFDHRGKVARQESAKLIREQLAKLGDGCRLVVTGDFNADEGSQPYQELFGSSPNMPVSLLDTFRSMHPERTKTEGTFSNFKATEIGGSRIDWIGCSRDWEVRQAGIDRTARDGRTPSDHFPVYAVLRTKTPNEKPTIRVLCYNIHHGEGTDGKIDLPRLARVIRQADPDLVALQEVDRGTKRTGGVDQTAELARLTGLHAAFGKAIDYQGGDYGQAILSRVAIGRGTVHQLPGEPEREQRIAFAVPLKLHDYELLFATTHLHHLSEPFRVRQAEKLNEVFANSPVPVIVAGDLNAEPTSKPLQVLRESWTVCDKPDQLTYPAEKPIKQIDYVLFRPKSAFRVVESRVINESVASDHRPVLVVLEVPASTPVQKVLAPYTRPTNIAHRGASYDAPEHTLAAYKLALEHGADYVEPDLQMTKDGVLVCLHDTSLERTTNVAKVFPDRAKLVNGRKTWPVADFTLAEIQQLDAGSWKDAKFIGEKVPTLQQMIDLVKGKAGLIPETKAPELYAKLGLNMEQALMAVLKKNGLDQPGADPKTPVIIQSFSAESLKILRKDHGCKLPLVITFSSPATNRETLQKYKEFADGIGPNKLVVLSRPEIVKEAHELGLSVTIWTCRSGQTGKFKTVREEMAYYLNELKVDAIFTDNPDQFPR